MSFYREMKEDPYAFETQFGALMETLEDQLSTPRCKDWDNSLESRLLRIDIAKHSGFMPWTNEAEALHRILRDLTNNDYELANMLVGEMSLPYWLVAKKEMEKQNRWIHDYKPSEAYIEKIISNFMKGFGAMSRRRVTLVKLLKSYAEGLEPTFHIDHELPPTLQTTTVPTTTHTVTPTCTTTVPTCPTTEPTTTYTPTWPTWPTCPTALPTTPTETSENPHP